MAVENYEYRTMYSGRKYKTVEDFNEDAAKRHTSRYNWRLISFDVVLDKDDIPCIIGVWGRPIRVNV